MKSKHKILIASNDASLCAEWTKALEKFQCRLLSGGENMIQRVFDEVPHLIVVDEDFEQGSGHALAQSVKDDAVLKYIPILMCTNEKTDARSVSDVNFSIDKAQGAKALAALAREAVSKNYNELDLNPLTHLPGTRSSVLCIEEAMLSKKLFAVCCVDLADLAAFNSAYGDARGDEIIIKLADLIKEALRREGSPDDFFGHLGGDDLLIVTRADLAVQISESIIQNFDAVIPNFYDPHDRKQGYIMQRNAVGVLTQYPIMSVSIAIVHNDYMPLTEMTEISQIAGELKKYMKTLPGSCYIKYRRRKPHDEPDAEEASLEVRFPSQMKSIRLSSVTGDTKKYALFYNSILKAKKIQTVYQPIINLKTRSIVGYEALTRALSDYPVNEATTLFSVARESGRVKELDKLCVEYALKNGQALAADKKLFLNLNHETLIDPKIMRDLFSNKGVIGYKNLVIEVTEQSILRSFDKVRHALLELKQQGVSVAIDDVGGGAVSLRDVAMLKPDYIKFDRSLIRQIDTSTTKQQIVLSMILFANGIQATTTAEGIETKEEYEAALMCGVSLGQGYYFARPGAPFPKVFV